MKHFVKPSRHHAGFTLIELMIVLVIVVVLAAIALPSYREQVAKSRRAEATGVLLESSQYQRRFYSANDTFTSTLPISLQQSPRESTPLYSVTLMISANTTSFTLTAVPITGGSMATDRCGSLVLNSTGGKSISGNNAATVVSECWR